MNKSSKKNEGFCVKCGTCNTVCPVYLVTGNEIHTPRGKQHLNPQGIWYTPVTGIWQSVWLEPLPADNHIEELRIRAIEESREIKLKIWLAQE